MMKNKLIMLLCLMMAVSVTYGQKVVKVSGNLTPLKGEKVFNLVYSYDNLMVGSKKEASYIEEKVKKYNSDEPGKGDQWKEAWFNDREARFQPKFEELFNKYLEDGGMSAATNSPDAKYTIHIKTTMIDPGWNVGVSRRPAYLNVTIEIYETETPSNMTAKFKVTKIPGSDVMGYDFESGWRIAEAYAKLGKIFGKYMIKNLK